MEINENIPLKTLKNKNNSKFDKKKILYYSIIIIMYIAVFCYAFKKLKLIELFQISQNISNLGQKIENLNTSQNINQNFSFNDNLNNKYINILMENINEQNNFCNNINGENKGIDDQIKLANVSFKNISFNMFVYKGKDVISKSIINSKIYQENEINNVLNALEYYSNKKNIKNKDIYILDIGANVGIYTFVLGKYGYKIISFEASETNNYILKKNYCINKDVDIILVNKGLYNEEKKCHYQKINNNIGNGFVVCDEKKNSTNISKTNKGNEEITLTKLSNFIPFLSDKYVALIKINIEGTEKKAIEGGIELITKYHVPFIIMEYSPTSLRSYQDDPKELLQIFEDNGYKFGLYNFFDEYYFPLHYIFERGIKGGSIPLYIVHSKILDK